MARGSRRRQEAEAASASIATPRPPADHPQAGLTVQLEVVQGGGGPQESGHSSGTHVTDLVARAPQDGQGAVQAQGVHQRCAPRVTHTSDWGTGAAEAKRRVSQVHCDNRDEEGGGGRPAAESPRTAHVEVAEDWAVGQRGGQGGHAGVVQGVVCTHHNKRYLIRGEHVRESDDFPEPPTPNPLPRPHTLAHVLLMANARKLWLSCRAVASAVAPEAPMELPVLGVHHDGEGEV